MFKKLAFIIVCIIHSFVSDAQNYPEYFIDNTHNGQYLVYGTRFLINSTDNPCYELIEEISISKGKKFTIMHIRDEMENRRGLIIFDNNGNQINYDKVQNERKKYYQPYDCCIFVEELKGKLYFWDYIEPYDNGEDYDCYYDSQTDASMYIIPRYYIFEHEEDSVKTIILRNKCTTLIQNSKIVCD